MIDDSLDREFAVPWALFFFAIPFAGLLAWDIIEDPRIFKNLFTYKYDREWNNAGWDSSFRTATFWISAPMFAGMMLLLVRHALAKKAGLIIMTASGIALALFCLNVYMPKISITWSQKGLWDFYFDGCTKMDGPPGSDPRKTYCVEPVVSYKLNWRGETYYSQNQVVPIRDDNDFTHFLSNIGDGTFYGIMENGRYRGEFQRNLPKRFKNKACIAYNKNAKFVLAKVPCAQDDPMRQQETKKTIKESKPTPPLPD